ncbi:MAG: ATP synthase subunit b precursor [Alphaproteobacteria bacterium ADurb.Bin438]|nr:MAG: ATP synthase subunit b precursor [Alphaproteobacteria bacterium ADurb.Bin438]
MIGEEKIVAEIHEVAHGEEHHSEIFYQSPEFWIFAAFLIVVFLLFKKVKHGFLISMKLHAEKIREKLSETRAIRDETQSELVSCQKKLREIQAEISEIVSDATETANRFKRDAKNDIVSMMKIKEEKVKDRIRLDELEFKAKVKRMLVSTSVASISILLENHEIDDTVLIHNTINEFSDILKEKM